MNLIAAVGIIMLLVSLFLFAPPATELGSAESTWLDNFEYEHRFTLPGGPSPFESIEVNENG